MAKFRRITALVLVLIMSISLLGINVLASEDATPVVEQSEQQVAEPAEEAAEDPAEEAEAPAEDASSDTDVLSAPVGPGDNGSRKKTTYKQTVYVYAKALDTSEHSPNGNGYYTLGTIKLELPTPKSYYLENSGDPTGRVRYDRYNKDTIEAALENLNATNPKAAANDWLSIDLVEFYTLHCASGATDYSDAPETAWHLDGEIKADNTHAVIYNSNTGDGSDTYSPDNAKYVQGAPITLATLEETNFSKEGYHFMGWSTDPNDNEAPPTTMGKKDITLYAMWKENWPVGYFVLNPTETYPENGDNMGAENYTPYGEQTIGAGDTSYKVDVNTGYKGGLTQSGWDKVEAFLADRTNRTLTFTAADLQAPTGADLGTNSADTITWYVIKKSSLAPIDNAIHVDGYVTNKPITITYYANYPNCAEPIVKDGRTGESHTVVVNPFDRTGYTFNGWNANANGSGTLYAEDSSIIPQTSMNLYAQWTKVETPVTYTTSYEWASADSTALPTTGLPERPTNGITFATSGDAIASKSATPAKDAVIYTTDGMWTFSGWGDGTLTDTNVAFTGTWTFTPAGEVVDPSTASFTVKKVDENGDALKGAEFSLKNSANEDITGTTAADGTEFTFSNLPEGTYTLTETKAPDGYQKVDTVWTVTVAKGTATITGPNATHGNIIHTIWNWIVKVTTGESDDLLNTDGVLTVTNSKVPGTFKVWSYYATLGGKDDYIKAYEATLPAGSKLQYTLSNGELADLTVAAINTMVENEILNQVDKYPGMRLESAYLSQANGNQDPNKGWDPHQMLTVTDGKVTGGADVIASFKIKSGLETRLHLTWELPYSVTYKNGDTVLQTNDGKGTYLYTGNTIPAYNGENPTKAEDANNTYKFSGWTVAGEVGENNTIGSTDLVYTAKFDATAKNYTLTINYVDEAGTVLSAPHKDATLTNGVTYSVDSPKITGYKLTDSAQSTVAGTIDGANVTVTVVYEKNRYEVTYTVTGDAPSAFIGTIPKTQSYLYQEEVTVAADLSTTVTTKGGIIGTWTFSSWTAGNATVKDGKFTMPASDVTLTGSWSFAKAGTYNVNYTDGITTYKAVVGADTGVPYTVLGNNDIHLGFAKEGYHFDGWTTTSGKSTEIGDTDTSDKTATITYTAIWERNTASLTITKDFRGISELPAALSFTVTGPADFNGGNEMVIPYSDFEKSNDGSARFVLKVPTGDYTVTENGAELFGYSLVTSYKVGFSPAVTRAAGGSDSVTGNSAKASVQGEQLVAFTNAYTYNPPYVPDVPTPTPTPTPTPPVETIDPGEVPLVPGPDETIDPDATPLDPSPKTGDNTDIALLWLVFCASFCGLVVIGVTAPKKRNDR